MADLCLNEELASRAVGRRWPLPGSTQIVQSAQVGLAVIILSAFDIRSGFYPRENDALPSF